jgi:hypothetical protein
MVLEYCNTRVHGYSEYPPFCAPLHSPRSSFFMYVSPWFLFLSPLMYLSPRLFMYLSAVLGGGGWRDSQNTPGEISRKLVAASTPTIAQWRALQSVVGHNTGHQRNSSSPGISAQHHATWATYLSLVLVPPAHILVSSTLHVAAVPSTRSLHEGWRVSRTSNVSTTRDANAH